MDEDSWIAASLEFPGSRFVTMAMDEVVFRHSVKEGTILTIKSESVKLGLTSVTYEVRVVDEQAQDDHPIFTTQVTFVKVDESGRKIPITK